MVLQAASTTGNPVQTDQYNAGWSTRGGDGADGGKVESVLSETTIHVGALIDAVCSRFGDWIDWERYRPHLMFHPGPDQEPVSDISLALPGDEHGLRAGGFIEMHVLPKQERVEASGGYYDEYNQPTPVIEGSLSWQDLTYQRLGQTLLLMYDRIVRAYGERSARTDEANDSDDRRPDREGVFRPERAGRQAGAAGGGRAARTRR